MIQRENVIDPTSLLPDVVPCSLHLYCLKYCLQACTCTACKRACVPEYSLNIHNHNHNTVTSKHPDNIQPADPPTHLNRNVLLNEVALLYGLPVPKQAMTTLPKLTMHVFKHGRHLSPTPPLT